MASPRRRPASRDIIRRRCSKLLSMAISTRSNQADWLERESLRNLEVMWLTGRNSFRIRKTIAVPRKRPTARPSKRSTQQFVALCRKMGLLAKARCCVDGQQVQGGQFARQQLHEGKRWSWRLACRSRRALCVI